MKFQDSSFNGLKVTVGTKSVTHAPTHARTHARSKSNMPHQLFQSWGHEKCDCHKNQYTDSFLSWMKLYQRSESIGIFVYILNVNITNVLLFFC